MFSPTALVLGPGGVKGFLELGFMLFMEENDILEKIDKIIGVSIGSIIALLYVIGYNIREIISEAAQVDFSADLSSFKLQESTNNFGLLSHDKIRQNLETMMKTKFGRILNLKELFQVSNIHLEMVAVKLDTTEVVYFSHLTTPTISAVDAALLSSNLPLILQLLQYNKSRYVDGALGDPYPIARADDGTRDVLGLYIKTHFDQKDNLFAYIGQIFYISMNRLREQSIATASNRCKHVELTSDIVDPLGMSITQEAKIKMILEGYDKAKKFFSQLYIENQT